MLGSFLGHRGRLREPEAELYHPEGPGDDAVAAQLWPWTSLQIQGFHAAGRPGSLHGAAWGCAIQQRGIPAGMYVSKCLSQHQAPFRLPQLTHHGLTVLFPLQARIADYMDALRCYRAMQRQLGPVAAQLARSLAPASADPGTLTGLAGATTESKLAAYATAATTAGCSPEELAELVALRKRLLYELPRMRAAVAGMGERGMQQGRPAAGSDGAAGAEAAAAPKSTRERGVAVGRAGNGSAHDHGWLDPVSE